MSDIQKTNTNKPDFAYITTKFASELTSIVDIYPKLYNEINKDIEATKSKFENLKLEEEEFDKQEEKRKYPFPLKKRIDFIKTKKEYEIYKYAVEKHPSAFVLSLVAQYDYFIQELVKNVFYTKPEIINSIQKSFSIADILKILEQTNSYEYIIEKEAESVLRDNHESQIKWFENKLKLKILSNIRKSDLFNKFIELTERRNLYAHNGGLVSVNYLKNTSSVYRKNISQPIKNSYLFSSKEYIQESYEILFELGIKLSQTIWRKLSTNKKVIKEADDSLSHITYQLLVLQNYKLANRLLEFAVNLPKCSSDYQNKIFTMNLAQSYKWLGNEKACNSIMTEVDWSASQTHFVLCKDVLLNDFKSAVVHLKESIKNKEITKDQIVEWPIFKDFRKSELFINAFENEYGKEE